MISISEKEFRQIADYVKRNIGINLRDEKKTLVNGRLNSVLEELGFKSFGEYYKYLESDKSGEAITTFIDKITTNHTFFMRETSHFYYFRDVLLPEFYNKLEEKDLRIWCAACSTGEEAYTLAILIDEYFGKKKFLWDTRVLATDISIKVLKQAAEGQYTKDKINSIPKEWKEKYFRVVDFDTYSVEDKIKNEVIFRRFNLMNKNFPFKKKFQVIFCRNVMIYFDNETKDDLVNRLYHSLEQGGYLFIGHSETINRSDNKFEYIMPAVYRKR